MSLFDRFVTKVRERVASAVRADDPDEAPAVTFDQVVGERAKAMREAGTTSDPSPSPPAPERPLHGSAAERAMMARARRGA